MVLMKSRERLKKKTRGRVLVRGEMYNDRDFVEEHCSCHSISPK